MSSRLDTNPCEIRQFFFLLYIIRRRSHRCITTIDPHIKTKDTKSYSEYRFSNYVIIQLRHAGTTSATRNITTSSLSFVYFFSMCCF